jgi:hypothetical protein
MPLVHVQISLALVVKQDTRIVYAIPLVLQTKQEIVRVFVHGMLVLLILLLIIYQESVLVTRVIEKLREEQAEMIYAIQFVNKQILLRLELMLQIWILMVIVFVDQDILRLITDNVINLVYPHHNV